MNRQNSKPAPDRRRGDQSIVGLFSVPLLEPKRPRTERVKSPGADGAEAAPRTHPRFPEAGREARGRGRGDRERRDRWGRREAVGMGRRE